MSWGGGADMWHMSSVPSLIAEYCAGGDVRLAVSRVEERSSSKVVMSERPPHRAGGRW